MAITEEGIRRILKEELGIRSKYLPFEGEVSRDKPATIYVKERLGYTSRHGFFVPEGSMKISINGVVPFTELKAGETIDLGKLEIERIDIITDSVTPVKFKGWVV